MSDIIGHLYRNQPPFVRNLQRWRPYVAPFASVFAAIPADVPTLDVGCGGGRMLNTLARTRRMRDGLGIDINAHAIATAQEVALTNGLDEAVRFESRAIEDLPIGAPWSCVTAIDVMHHVPTASQRAFVGALADRVAPGGRLVIRDPVKRPLWRNLANITHDLVLARQLVHSRDAEQVIGWVSSDHFLLVSCKNENRLWYGF